jgi:hypothetical protein
MFNKTLTAIALAAAVGVTAPPAHAAWFVPSAHCQSIEDVSHSLGWLTSLPLPHSPDDILRELGSVGVRDETAEVARKVGQDPHPDMLRMLNFGGPHGHVIFVADKELCLANPLPASK